ncbi:hypothetical protein ACFLW8_05555, partial [Chloroflexota bacterium]
PQVEAPPPTRTTGGLVSMIPEAIKDFSEGRMISGYTLSIIEAQLGVRLPLWTRIIRYFWAFFIVLGCILGFKMLLRIRSLSPPDKIVVGGLIGMCIVAAISAVLSKMEESSRVLIYIPLFTVPIVVRFFSSFSDPVKKCFITVFAILILAVLSFPTFLAHHEAIYKSSFSPYEIKSGEFLESAFGKGSKLTVFATNWHFRYYTPYADSKRLMWHALARTRSEDKFLHALGTYVTQFRESNQREATIYELSGKRAHQFQYFVGIDPTKRLEWRWLIEELSKENKIYGNSFVQFYQTRGSGNEKEEVLSK